LPKAGFVSLRLYGVNGRLQSEIIGQQQAAGYYSINQRQMPAAAGLYVVIFKAGEYFNKQMVYLIK
jgi:5-hydroxyisourate hydrolase-like protein (transthyretin family)